LAKDVADIAAVARVRTIGADTDNVIGRGDAATGALAQGRVLAASGVVRERTSTGGRVVVAGVEQERINTVCRVVEAGDVAIEGLKTVGRIAETGGVFIERSKTSGRVEAAGVAIQRTVTSGRAIRGYDESMIA